MVGIFCALFVVLPLVFAIMGGTLWLACRMLGEQRELGPIVGAVASVMGMNFLIQLPFKFIDVGPIVQVALFAVTSLCAIAIYYQMLDLEFPKALGAWLIQHLILGLVCCAPVLVAGGGLEQLAKKLQQNANQPVVADAGQPDEPPAPAEPQPLPAADPSAMPVPAETQPEVSPTTTESGNGSVPAPATDTPVEAPVPTPAPAETPVVGEPTPAPAETLAEPTFPPGLKGDAQQAFHDGRVADGNSFLEAALLTSDDKALWDQVRWCPALGRPVAGVRWGIGVQIPDNIPLRSTAPQQGNDPPAVGDNADQPGAAPARANDVASNVLREMTGDIGSQVLAALPAAQTNGLLGQLPTGGKSQGGAQYVGKGPDMREVMSLARQSGVDVLVLAAISVKVQGINRNVDASLTFRMFDVTTEKRLWSSQTLSSSQVRAAMGKGQNPGTELVRSLNEYLETNFQLQPKPSLDKDKIRLRAEAVAREEPINPLPALVEVRYYQRLELLTPLQAELCYQRLIDADDAEKMASGSDADRRRAIDRYLPMARRN